MLWGVTKLSDAERQKVLALNESHFLDFKSKESIPKILKTCSAFANADGGELFVGIRDQRDSNRLGFLYENQEEANACITEVFSIFSDGQEYISCAFLEFSNGLCVHFTVQKTPFVVRAGAQIYRRQNAQDREIKGSEITKLELEKGVVSFEDSTVDADASELESARMMELFMSHIIPSGKYDDFLRKERLLNGGKLRACALVLFDDNPQSLLPHAAVKIYRYKTLATEGEREDLDGQPDTIEGPAYEVIFDAVKRTREVIESIPLLSESGLISVRYPQEAIHEVVCNAILHRDYSINDYVHIRVFDNRVEVESPGRLAGSVTVRNILRTRFARNKKLVRLTAKFPTPPNKDVGEGLNTAFKSMQQLNLGRPEIEERDSSVMVRLRHEPLASKEQIIRDYLIEQKYINNTKARQICNVQSDSIIRKLFHAMIGAKEIEKIPGTRGKGTKYRLVGKVEAVN